MAYFPAFVNIQEQKVLLVGGGKIALEKLQKLLDFTQNITLIATHYTPKMQEHIKKYHLKYLTKHYEQGDVIGYDIVVVAVDIIEVQKNIYEETRSLRCLCNCVDSKEYCDFIFPSFIQEGDLCIAISTAGSSPAFAKQFKNYIKGKIPQDIATFLAELKRLRSTLPKGKERMQLFEQKVKQYIEKLP